MPHDDEILTAEEVAQLLQLNIDYVRKLSREGTIPATGCAAAAPSATSKERCWTGCVD